jgi:hypothetical protein
MSISFVKTHTELKTSTRLFSNDKQKYIFFDLIKNIT